MVWLILRREQGTPSKNREAYDGNDPRRLWTGRRRRRRTIALVAVQVAPRFCCCCCFLFSSFWCSCFDRSARNVRNLRRSLKKEWRKMDENRGRSEKASGGAGNNILSFVSESVGFSIRSWTIMLQEELHLLPDFETKIRTWKKTLRISKHNRSFVFLLGLHFLAWFHCLYDLMSIPFSIESAWFKSCDNSPC